MIARVLTSSALVLALALAAAARAQTERLAGRLPEPTRAAVAALADSMREAGVPADPLVNKALEGVSKGADGARILAAVRALASDLTRARAALGTAATEAELVAGAAALRAGASPAFLTRLRREARGPLVQPLAVMADLVARGVPADTATQSVLALVRAGVHDADLVAFRQSVERDIALGAAAGAAADARLTGVAGIGTGVTGAVPTGPGVANVPRKP